MASPFTGPIESDPKIFNRLIRKIGVNSAYRLTDVCLLNDGIQELIQQPVKAFILLIPNSDANEAHRRAEYESLKDNLPEFPKELYFMRQYADNCSATVAVIHIIFNILNSVLLDENTTSKNFYERTRFSTPEERGRKLEEDRPFIALHNDLAAQGQSEQSSGDVNHHYIALINYEEKLYEMDGRKNFPICHGATSDVTFLMDAVKVSREFIARDPNNLKFTALAYAGKTNLN